MTDDLADDLAAYLADDDGPLDDSTENFDVADEALTSADDDEARRIAVRYLRRLGRLDAEAEAVKAAADDERDRIARWEADRLHGIDRGRAWLRAALEPWFRRHAAARKVRSLNLPTGTLSLKANRPPELVVEAGAVDELAASHPEFVKVERSLLVREVRKATKPGPEGVAVLVDSGEVLPGVSYGPKPEASFYVDPAK